jgi:heme/copper-type cytochrome/quinol oxidase subunit 2
MMKKLILHLYNLFIVLIVCGFGVSFVSIGICLITGDRAFMDYSMQAFGVSVIFIVVLVVFNFVIYMYSLKDGGDKITRSTQEGTALEWTQRRTIEEVRDLINKGEQKENGKYSE